MKDWELEERNLLTEAMQTDLGQRLIHSGLIFPMGLMFMTRDDYNAIAGLECQNFTPRWTRGHCGVCGKNIEDTPSISGLLGSGPEYHAGCFPAGLQQKINDARREGLKRAMEIARAA